MKVDPKWKDFWLELFRAVSILTFVIGGLLLGTSIIHPSAAYVPSDDGLVAAATACRELDER